MTFPGFADTYPEATGVAGKDVLAPPAPRRSSGAVLWSCSASGTSPSLSWPRSWGISESCLRRWAAQDDVDAGRRDGVSSEERSELAQLRRDKRRLEVQNEILRRAAAYSARENVIPK